MKKENEKKKKGAITRREFMQYSAAAGAALTVPGFFAGCSDSGGSTSSDTESRTYYFDLSHADPAHNFHLKAGATYVKLNMMDSETLKTARQSNPMLALVPDENITHYIKDVPLSSENICLCWIVGQDPHMDDGTWSMPLMFYHLPKSALQAAAQWPGATLQPGANKFALYGADPGAFAGDPDAYLLEDDFKNTQDQATALVCGHQELMCGEPNSAAHIQKNIIGPQSRTRFLAEILHDQGPATENGGWATQEVYINRDTGKPYLNSKGQKQYFPRWSQETLKGTGGAIIPSLQQAKNDTTLGANITGLDPSQDNAHLSGKIWNVRDGITSVDAGTGLSGSGFKVTFPSYSCLHGYHAKVVSVDNNRNAKVEITNSYVRYLGLYIRYIDGDDNPIPVKGLPPETLDTFPNWAVKYNTPYDNLAMLIEPEFEVLGIPLKSDRQTFTINMPPAASKALVLAGGLGHGVTAYPDMVHKPGTACTAIMNLAAPAIFLATAAASGYGRFIKKFALSGGIQSLLMIIENIVFSSIMAADYSDAEALATVGKSTGLFLLSTPWFVKDLNVFLAEGEAIDSVPIIGTILQAAAAAGLVASLAQTVAEVCRSPKVYKYTLTFTHDINVTIKHDPKNFEFPSVATHYQVKAFFDSGTPHVSPSIDMPGTSQSKPLTYSFKNVPYGGKVKISVGFYSDNQWLAGQGSTGSIPNDETAATVTITIKQNKVPLRIDTVYSHKEKTVLDANGNLVWHASDAPTATKVDLSCGNQNGDLCELTCITVSEHFAAAGYSWKSYSDDLESCDSGAHGQLFQFASMSIAQNPESGHKRSGCGFSNMVRLVYDLMGSQNNNFYLDTTGGKQLARQIRLAENQKPDFDGPDSDKSWGRFNLPSDALLLHPSRKLISINSEYDKIEVLSLPDEAVHDNKAPLARVYSATGTREGLISGPICGAIAPDGAILILESKNRRIQAFDLGGNPAKHFGANKDKYYVSLKEETSAVTYLDMAVEYMGYLYVLSYITPQGLYQYRLDIYTPGGDWLCRTTGVNASKLDVDFWRNAYTLNYERLTYPDETLPTVTEPSVSQWIPSTP